MFKMKLIYLVPHNWPIDIAYLSNRAMFHFPCPFLLAEKTEFDFFHLKCDLDPLGRTEIKELKSYA